ncbi:glycosyl transferase [Actinocatenispora thailandica]|uniref:Glycosyl transferase n=1 Tax=Actinocatenispora thailandica TaxID=227318 RepID=A0A7R7I117_9ACTN|nr:nucleotide disphospho-sugar-binding domain-containing protein [Actinocatenispora thailandica]BCJ39186.1 glycosyl transferase [Actinocatenispora thailandica]
MRALLVAAPLLGHLFPLVPLADALRTAGHEVRLASAGAAATDAGVAVDDLLPGFRYEPIARRATLRHPFRARAERSDPAGTVTRFAEINRRLRAPLTDLVSSFAPQIVVYEPSAPVAAAVAAEHALPAVLHEISLREGRPLAAAVLARLGTVAGTDPIGTFTVAPPSLVGDRPGWPMRYVPYAAAGDVPGWLREPPPDRPRILVTRPTAPSRRDRLMAAVLTAAARLDAEIVLIRPDRRLMTRPLPDNARWVEWVPLPSALRTAAAVVHHGGAGTMLTALALGVPQLVPAEPGDRGYHAALLADRGAGLTVTTPDQIDPGTLDRLLADPALHTAVAEVRAEIAAMPAPATLIDRLTALT